MDNRTNQSRIFTGDDIKLSYFGYMMQRLNCPKTSQAGKSGEESNQKQGGWI